MQKQVGKTKQKLSIVQELILMVLNNRCGFYGNPIYRGYCSKCYKESLQAEQKESKTQSSASAGPEEVGMWILLAV